MTSSLKKTLLAIGFLLAILLAGFFYLFANKSAPSSVMPSEAEIEVPESPALEKETEKAEAPREEKGLPTDEVEEVKTALGVAIGDIEGIDCDEFLSGLEALETPEEKQAYMESKSVEDGAFVNCLRAISPTSPPTAESAQEEDQEPEIDCDEFLSGLEALETPEEKQAYMESKSAEGAVLAVCLREIQPISPPTAESAQEEDQEPEIDCDEFLSGLEALETPEEKQAYMESKMAENGAFVNCLRELQG